VASKLNAGRKRKAPYQHSSRFYHGSAFASLVKLDATRLHPAQVGHADIIHFGIECKRVSNQTAGQSKRFETRGCAAEHAKSIGADAKSTKRSGKRGYGDRSECSCGLPHGNAYAGVTDEDYQHNARIHLMLAIMSEQQIRNPNVILNIENPAETLEKHPLIKLAENPVGDSPPAGLGLKHFRFSQCFFRRDSRRKDTSWWTTSPRLYSAFVDSNGNFCCLCRQANGCNDWAQHICEGRRGWTFPKDAAVYPREMAEQIAFHLRIDARLRVGGSGSK